jgi:hypothetical protein
VAQITLSARHPQNGSASQTLRRSRRQWVSACSSSTSFARLPHLSNRILCENPEKSMLAGPSICLRIAHAEDAACHACWLPNRWRRVQSLLGARLGVPHYHGAPSPRSKPRKGWRALEDSNDAWICPVDRRGRPGCYTA